MSFTLQVNTHIMEVVDSQISCENCYFGSKMSNSLQRGGAEIVSDVLSNTIFPHSTCQSALTGKWMIRVSHLVVWQLELRPDTRHRKGAVR